MVAISVQDIEAETAGSSTTSGSPSRRTPRRDGAVRFRWLINGNQRSSCSASPARSRARTRGKPPGHAGIRGITQVTLDQRHRGDRPRSRPRGSPRRSTSPTSTPLGIKAMYLLDPRATAIEIAQMVR
jgi:hypothetical protein